MSISIRIELHDDNDDPKGLWHFETVPYTYMYPADGDEEAETFRQLIVETSRFEGEDDGDDQTTLYYGGTLTDLAGDLAGSIYEGNIPVAPGGYGDATIEIGILY